MSTIVELRLLRYVIAVSEELHFTRAASREHVAQPTLSFRVQELERRLGVQLFVRDQQRVRVTAAGRAFVKEARIVLAHADRAVQSAMAFKSSGGDEITVGYSPQMNLRLLMVLRNLAQRTVPRIRINLISSHTPEQLEAISRDVIHVGLVTLPFQHQTITSKLLVREPLTVALPQSHRLSGKTHLKARELNGERLFSLPRHFHPTFHDHLFRLFKKEGYSPNLVQEVTSEPEVLCMVAEGFGVAFVRQSAITAGYPGVVYRRIREPSLVQETAIAYRRSPLSEIMQSFIAALRGGVEQIKDELLAGPETFSNVPDPRQLTLF